MNLGPVVNIAKPKELTAAEVADGNAEGRLTKLDRQGQAMRVVELFRSVDREAERGASQPAAEERHRGGVGAKVRVEMFGAFPPRMPFEHASFKEVKKVFDYAGARATADADGPPQGCQKKNRPHEHQAENRRHARVRSGLLQNPSSLRLGSVGW